MGCSSGCYIDHSHDCHTGHNTGCMDLGTAIGSELSSAETKDAVITRCMLLLYFNCCRQ